MPRRPVRRAGGVAVAALVLALAGCGSDDSTTGSSDTLSESPTTSSSIQATTEVTSDDLGAAYVSTSLDGDGFVDGASVTMLFEQGTMSV